MAGIRSAVMYSALSRYSIRLLALVSAMVLARLLTPSELGTYAIASSVVMLLSEFRMLGASSYLVREKVLSPQKIRSAYGLTIIISWGLGVAIAGSSPFLAKFYKMSEIAPLFIILSLSFFLAPYISIPLAIHSRELNYKYLMIVQNLTAVAEFVSAVLLVLMGYSFYSLAWARGVATLVELIAVLFLRPRGIPWVPSFRRLSDVARVGFLTSLASILRRTQTTAPDLVIGKMGMPTQVGMFSRGMGFIEFVSQSIEAGITPVTLPYLSAVVREEGDINAAFIKATRLFGALVWPVLAVASLVSYPAIRLFFGEQWDAAAPIASILAFWALFRSIHSLSAPLLIVTGGEVWLVAKEAIAFVLYLVAMIFSFKWGLTAVAQSLVVVAAINILLALLLLKFSVNLSIWEFFAPLVPNFIISLVCWIATLLIGRIIDFRQANPMVPVGWVALVLPIIWLITVRVLKHDIYYELETVFAQLRDRFKAEKRDAG
jgi:O-antigen/teichoic acid export membrane protein